MRTHAQGLLVKIRGMVSRLLRRERLPAPSEVAPVAVEQADVIAPPEPLPIEPVYVVPEPAPVIGPGRFEDRAFANRAGRRDYKLFIPGCWCGQKLPLVVMLHGCSQNPDDFAAGTRMNEAADERGWFVAYPAQCPSANASKCWNWFNPGDQRRGEGEPSLIAGITQQVMADYGVDPGRVYVAGLSAGGAAAAIMGMTYPDLYAAIGVHSGLACGTASDLLSALTAMRRGSTSVTRHPGGAVPTIVFHGDQDTTVHPQNGDMVIVQSRGSARQPLHTNVERGSVPGGCAFTRILHADDDGRVILEQWVVHGAGHAWSGGSPDGSYTDPTGPDATREMLRFFAEHVSA